MNKIFVFDLDGTLLRTDLSISQKTTKCLEELYQHGCILIIATGRSESGLPNSVKNILPLFKYLILSDGTVVTKQGVIVEHNTIDAITAHGLLALLFKLDVMLEIQVNRKWYMKTDYRENISQFLPDDILPYILDSRIFVRDFSEVFGDDYPVEKINVNYRRSTTRCEKQKVMDLCQMFNDVRYTNDAVHKTDILSFEATKGKALKKLIELEKLQDFQIIVFGNDYNDIDVFEIADESVAMRNACDELKSKATYVTGENNEDGVAEYLIQMLQ